MTEQKKITRRKFLQGCLTATAVGIALCGGGALVGNYQPPVEQPTSNSGDPKMNNRVLVTYATKAGSAGEVAARMAETLTKRGLAVDLMPVNKVTDLSPYKTVFLGSGIYMGNLLPEAKSFVEKNKSALAEKTLNAFFVCMTLEKDTEENRKTVSAYLDPIRALVKPANEGMFAGVFNPNKVSLLYRLIGTAMKTPVGDFRKWDQITAWTEQAAPAL
jgi:menaquinone-dependent protoporphyrinogen oxidase